MDAPRSDLVIIKDVLQHLPNETIIRVLDRISQCRIMLITNDVHDKHNMDCKNGDWRGLNLFADPFKINGCYVFNFDDRKNKKTILALGKN